jgi:hypothetical protein
MKVYDLPNDVSFLLPIMVPPWSGTARFIFSGLIMAF